MIVQSIVQWLANGIAYLLGLLPTFTLPTWVPTATGFWATSIGNAVGLAQWFPLPLISIVGAAILGSVVLSIGIKGIRIIASFLTLGGGSAS